MPSGNLCGILFDYFRIFAQAAANVTGRQPGFFLPFAKCPPTIMKKVEILDKKRVFSGFLNMEEVTARFEKHNGEMSLPVKRLMVERGDAVAAILWDKDKKEVLLTNQFRLPAYEKGPGWLWELVAGSVEAGEAPEACMIREIEEEAGYSVASLRHISTFYTSPGGTSERILLYFAVVGAADKTSEGGGLESENEDILTEGFSLDRLREACANGEICDAKTYAGALWLLLQGPGFWVGL